MSVLGTIDVLESELWPQRDARDPLGLFGWRVTQAGDGTGGGNKVIVEIASSRRHAYVYKIYDMVIAQTVGAVASRTAKVRILTNWPNIDLEPGIQSYGSLWVGEHSGTSAGLTVPQSGFFRQTPFAGNYKDLLIFDPSTQTGPMAIAELEIANVDVTTFSFEGYGYYWDRSVMGTPGGPRNPGTS